MIELWPLWLIPVLVVLGIGVSAWLVHSRVELPAHFRIKLIAGEEVDPVDLALLSRYDEELAQLGFEKVGDFEISGVAGENLHRVFVHRSDNTEATVSVFVSGLRKIPHLEFYTRFQNRGSLSTDQAVLPNYFEIPPEREIQRFPGLGSAKLYPLHKNKVAELAAAGRNPVAVSKESVFRYIEEDQQELLNYQIEKGFLLADAEGDLLRPSWKFALYFIVRNLDPIPFGIGNLKLVSVLLACAAIMFGFFAFARFGEPGRLLSQFGLVPPGDNYAVCAAGALIGGLTLGFIIQRRGFLWAGLIAVAGLFIFIHNLFPNDWIIILIAAQAGFVGNRIFESRLTRSPTRLPGQLMVLIALTVIGWLIIMGK